MEYDDAPVIFVYPADWDGPLAPHPRAWHLRTDEPGEAVLRFAERNGAVVVRAVRETTVI